VLSRAYQMSSEHSDSNYATDPDNKLVWRMNRRRMDAEAIRDSILYVAGSLDLKRPEGSPTQSINEDGTSETPVSSVEIMQLQNVSPDGRWALIGVTPNGGHGDTNVTIVAVPLDGGTPQTICDRCAFGYGTTRSSPPLISWSPDGQWIYVPLRSFTFGSSKTIAIPIRLGSAPPRFTSGFNNEADFARIPGAHLIDQDNVFPSTSPGYFVTARRSAKANLFRIYLP